MRTNCVAISVFSSPLSRRLLRLGLLTPAVLILSGCGDESPAILTPEVNARLTRNSQVSTTRDLFAVARFAPELTISGSLKPGDNVEIDWKVRALMTSPDTRISIRLPEIETAKVNGWRHALPKTGPVPAAVDVRRPLQENSSATGRISIPVIVPGFYRVVLTATSPTSATYTPSGDHIQNTSHREVWLLINEQGGQVTEQFDPTLLPDSALHQVGPRVLHNRASRAARGTTSGNVSLMTYGVAGYFKYYNPDTGAYVPLSVGRVSLQIWDEYSGQLTWDSPQYTSTGADGYFEGECPQTWTDRYTYIFHLEGAVSFNGAGDAQISFWSTDCGTMDALVVTSSNYGHAYYTLNRVASISQTLYERTRSQGLYVELGNFDNSYYSKEQEWGPSPFSYPDRIRLSTSQNPSHTWGAWGKFVMAHEYGHGFHHRALGDYPSTGSGCQDHSFSSLETPTCALVEGFADFHAVATLGDETGERTSFEANSYLPGGQDGSQTEGAVAAFLYDLADGANETDDQLSGSLKYVGDLTTTCLVQSSTFPYNFKNREVSHLVYCAENQVDSWVRSNFFLGSEIIANSESESAAEPTSWSVGTVRDIWMRNLYDQ